jgi:CPA2 family monovalent cation:H+ antiporter-2
VGYGPVGRTLARLLRDNEIEPTIIEMNLDTVSRLRAAGREAVYGDAGHRETLKAAGLGRAASLILSASGLRNAEEIIRLARELNPGVRVLVRCAYLREMPALRKAGADGVFSGEGEVALAMTESVLRELGAVHEQIDRERERVRADLFTGLASSGDVEPPAGQSMADGERPTTPGQQPSATREEAVREGEPRPDAVAAERGGTPPAPVA